MRELVKYRIVCKECENSDVIIIQDFTIIWGDNKKIISGRFRLDRQWGWQCGVCQNNDIMTRQEIRQITNKQNPEPQEIESVLKNLIPDKPKFLMQRV